MARDAALEQKIAGLSAEEVSAAVKRHIDPATDHDHQSGDFKKGGRRTIMPTAP